MEDKQAIQEAIQERQADIDQCEQIIKGMEEIVEKSILAYKRNANAITFEAINRWKTQVKQNKRRLKEHKANLRKLKKKL